MPSTAPEVDEFLAKLPDDQRAALQKLRETIRLAAPEAEERIGYGVPPSTTKSGPWSRMPPGRTIAPSMCRARR